MDGNGNMNSINWKYIEPRDSALRNNLGLQLMSSMVEKPLLDRVFNDHSSSVTPPYMNIGPYHHHHHHNRASAISEPLSNPFDYYRAKERFPNDLQINHNHPNCGISFAPQTISDRSFQMPQQVDSPSSNSALAQMQEFREEQGNKGKFLKLPSKGKKPKSRARKDKSTSMARSKRAPPKKSAEVVINGVTMDISGITAPICSCTGTPRQCYRWGSGGWQSSCCTTSLSAYPLPSSTKRRGTRIAGRKMSLGAFKKVLEKLASEGYDFLDPIDLRGYWAKHGTNKFVTIR